MTKTTVLHVQCRAAARVVNRWIASAATFGLLTTTLWAAEPQALLIPAANLSTSPEPLAGFVFSPQGSGPWPAVILLHGCGGAYTKAGELNARHTMWSDYLVAQGYVVLILDSFKSRGIRTLCSVRFDQRTLKESDRVGDAYAALDYLRKLPAVDGERIALMGWSHGGGVTLKAMSRSPKLSLNTLGGFKAAVAFYPGCTSHNRHAGRFHLTAPLLLLIGEADDWTPAEPCKALSHTVAARGEPMQIVTYPNTFHDFDNPALRGSRLRTDVPNGVKPGAGVTIAPNPQAREDAKTRVTAFLRQHLH